MRIFNSCQSKWKIFENRRTWELSGWYTWYEMIQMIYVLLSPIIENRQMVLFCHFKLSFLVRHSFYKTCFSARNNLCLTVIQWNSNRPSIRIIVFTSFFRLIFMNGNKSHMLDCSKMNHEFLVCHTVEKYIKEMK